MKTSPSTGTYLLSCKSTLCWLSTTHAFQFFLMTPHAHSALGWVTFVHVFIPILDYDLAGKDYMPSFACLSAPCRIWHCLLIKSTNAREGIDGRKGNGVMLENPLPGESILMSPYWLWSLSLDQADARLSNIPFSLSFTSWLTPSTSLQIWWMKTQGCLETWGDSSGSFLGSGGSFKFCFLYQERNTATSPYSHT